MPFSPLPTEQGENIFALTMKKRRSVHMWNKFLVRMSAEGYKLRPLVIFPGTFSSFSISAFFLSFFLSFSCLRKTEASSKQSRPWEKIPPFQRGTFLFVEFSHFYPRHKKGFLSSSPHCLPEELYLVIAIFSGEKSPSSEEATNQPTEWVSEWRVRPHSS